MAQFVDWDGEPLVLSDASGVAGRAFVTPFRGGAELRAVSLGGSAVSDDFGSTWRELGRVRPASWIGGISGDRSWMRRRRRNGAARPV